MAYSPPISPLQPWLAPLAGYSNLPFRLLCREHGCAVAVTEMVSAKGLLLGSSGTADLLATCPEDHPLVVQLFGAEPEVLGEATARLRQQGFGWFDLNAGCAVPKVTKTGAGAALLRDPGRISAVAEAMVAAAGRNAVGVKLRLGWNETQHTYLDIARRLEAVGVGWITLHPRTASQGFSGTARTEHLRRLKAAVPLPVLASGDLFTAEDAVRCLETTGVDGVMFARGAMGDPAIFERFTALMRGTPPPTRDLASIRACITRLAALHHRWGSPRQGLLQLRTLAPRFFRGMPQARAIRTRLIHCSTWEEALDCIADPSEES
ncbi:MAG: dihydrouridine synthase [Desulfomicrobiaceae bacterium]|nr:dihydrouridine synthase [Desulfomicrobiaceae bacterium]